MTRQFRLLKVWGSQDSNSIRYQETRKSADCLLAEISRSATLKRAASWVTVLIGKNGVGKSRMLSGVADIFEAIDDSSPRVRTPNRVARIAYAIDNHECEIVVDHHYQLHAKLDGRACKLQKLPLPPKVIALTTTPFDKFRVPRDLSLYPGNEEASERYTYLGLRDRTGRASPTSVIYRALEGLFLASTSEAARRSKIAEVFKFLGYKPQVEVRYQLALRFGEHLRAIAEGEPLDKIFLDESPNRIRLIERMLQKDPSLIDEIRQGAKEVIGRLEKSRFFELRANFSGHSDDAVFFKRVQLLSRMRIVQIRSVELNRISDNITLDLKHASSGELGIVTGFLGLASVIEDGSLIFIDEPEISLHPEWQTRYIELLLNTFEDFKGCHFILATHSPLILADTESKNSNVVSLDIDQQATRDVKNFAGRSSDHLLVTAFRVPGKNNLYLKQELIKALRLAASGEVASLEFSETLAPMIKLLPQLDENSPVAKLINELDAARNVRVEET